MATIYYETNPAPAVDNKTIETNTDGKLQRKYIECTDMDDYETKKALYGEADYLILDGDHTYENTNIKSTKDGIMSSTSATDVAGAMGVKNIINGLSTTLTQQQYDDKKAAGQLETGDYRISDAVYNPEMVKSHLTDITGAASLKQADVAGALSVKELNSKVGNASSATAVTGADAFTKINTLNSKISDEIEPKITPYETDTLGGSAYTSNITYQFNTVEKRGNEVHLCLSASATVDFGSGKSIASIPSKYRKSASYNVNGFIVSNENVTVPIKFNVINGTISQDYTPNARRFFIDTIYFI